MKNAAFMRVKCRRSCGECNCEDFDDTCPVKAEEGECLTNADWMKVRSDNGIHLPYHINI